jgi:hypothetical protein
MLLQLVFDFRPDLSWSDAFMGSYIGYIIKKNCFKIESYHFCCNEQHINMLNV